MVLPCQKPPYFTQQKSTPVIWHRESPRMAQKKSLEMKLGRLESSRIDHRRSMDVHGGIHPTHPKTQKITGECSSNHIKSSSWNIWNHQNQHQNEATVGPPSFSTAFLPAELCRRRCELAACLIHMANFHGQTNSSDKTTSTDSTWFNRFLVLGADDGRCFQQFSPVQSHVSLTHWTSGSSGDNWPTHHVTFDHGYRSSGRQHLILLRSDLHPGMIQNPLVQRSQEKIKRPWIDSQVLVDIYGYVPLGKKEEKDRASKSNTQHSYPYCPFIIATRHNSSEKKFYFLPSQPSETSIDNGFPTIFPFKKKTDPFIFSKRLENHHPFRLRRQGQNSKTADFGEGELRWAAHTFLAPAGWFQGFILEKNLRINSWRWNLTDYLTWKFQWLSGAATNACASYKDAENDVPIIAGIQFKMESPRTVQRSFFREAPFGSASERVEELSVAGCFTMFYILSLCRHGMWKPTRHSMA